ncbi:hypothetical protein [Aporhodopirellula aestuarii]|uniref:Uncharacterized protein n=1 Tax=Aporhodopirellula aestuarii TaxID=2950107 RepID=A0ABT0UDE2_9BACT|nr:hypothetical protein [Aporhodopirellula aestuarii]MCM2374894.1 hypothetical protein [Aporhodopirellula aestuarii]
MTLACTLPVTASFPQIVHRAQSSVSHRRQAYFVGLSYLCTAKVRQELAASDFSKPGSEIASQAMLIEITEFSQKDILRRVLHFVATSDWQLRSIDLR